MQRIGMIGCGKIAQVRHIPELSNNPDARIEGYYNPTTSRAEEMAAKYGGKVYQDIDSLLADPNIDAVVISLANTAHAEVTIKALKAGKHVLCEKPMATTIEECEQMADTAEKCGKALMIAQNLRLTAAYRYAHNLLAEGEIGKVLTFRTVIGHGGPEKWSINPGNSTWFFNRNVAAMGAMADLGIHNTDIIQYLLGQNVVSVKATVSTLDKKDTEGRQISVEDNALCIYTMNGGAVGTLSASWTYYGASDNSTVLYGTKGIMKISDQPEALIEIIKPEQTPRLLHPDQFAANANSHPETSGMTALFVETLEKTDKAALARNDFFLSGRSVIPAMRAVFAAVRSSREGIEVKIPENVL